MKRVPVFMFTHVPKTGGHTFTRMLMESYHPEELCIRNPIGIEAKGWNKHLVWMAGHSCKRTTDIGQRRKHVRFAMIRDPVQRIVSHHNVLCKHARERNEEEPTLQMTCKKFAKQMTNYLGSNPRHWADFTIIGRTDRFEQFVEAVEGVVQHRLTRVEPQNVGRVASTVTKVEADMIRRICSDDVILWDALKDRCP